MQGHFSLFFCQKSAPFSRKKQNFLLCHIFPKKQAILYKILHLLLCVEASIITTESIGILVRGCCKPYLGGAVMYRYPI